MTMTTHAKQRLAERYGMTLTRDMDALLFLISLKKYRMMYRDVKRETWILQVRLSGRNVLVVYNPFKQIVITVIPEEITFDKKNK